MDCSLPGSSVHGFSRQEYWSGCQALLQGIFPTQGLDPCLFCLLHCQGGSLPLAPPGKTSFCLSQHIFTLAISCKELTHWKRLQCWQGLGAGGEGDDRGWDGWMASLTMDVSLSELWELVMNREAWRAAIHGVAKSRTWLSDWTELNTFFPRTLTTIVKFLVS